MTVFKTIESFPPELQASMFEFAEAIRNDGISEIKELTKSILRIQKRTDSRIDKLTIRLDNLIAAQLKSDARIDALIKRMDDLVERMDALTKHMDDLAERMDALTKRVDELAEQMEALTKRVDALAERMEALTKRVDALAERMDKLAEAQHKTEQTLQAMMLDFGHIKENQKRMWKELGGLSHSLGYSLENKAMKKLPEIMAAEGYTITGELIRDYITIGKEHIEFNILGDVSKGSKIYRLIGECKSQPRPKDLRKFLKNCDKIGGEQVKVFIGHLFTPEFKEAATLKNVFLVPSYKVE